MSLDLTCRLCGDPSYSHECRDCSRILNDWSVISMAKRAAYVREMLIFEGKEFSRSVDDSCVYDLASLLAADDIRIGNIARRVENLVRVEREEYDEQ